MYPEKLIDSILEEHVKKFVQSEYRLDCRSKDKAKPWGVATIFLDPLVKNHKKN